jgi:hypothetical protein
LPATLLEFVAVTDTFTECELDVTLVVLTVMSEYVKLV